MAEDFTNINEGAYIIAESIIESAKIYAETLRHAADEIEQLFLQTKKESIEAIRELQAIKKQFEEQKKKYEDELAALLDDVNGEGGKVQERAGTQDHSHKVIPGHVVGFLGTLLGGEHQETYKHNAGHERGQTDLFQPAGEQGHIDAEQGKQSQYAVDNQTGFAFPDPDIGLLVILFHDGFQIHRLLLDLLFLEKCHGDYLLG